MSLIYFDDLNIISVLTHVVYLLEGIVLSMPLHCGERKKTSHRPTSQHSNTRIQNVLMARYQKRK